MVTKDRIVPAFDVQIRIISRSEQGVHNLGPIRLTKSRKAMFGNAGMANAVRFQELVIDERVLRMDVKYARAEFMNV